MFSYKVLYNVLAARIKDCRLAIEKIRTTIASQENQFNAIFNDNEMKVIRRTAENKKHDKQFRKKIRQCKLYEKSTRLPSLTKSPPNFKKNNIHNLSNYQLTNEEEEALCKGLNFCYGLRKEEFAITDTIIAVENALNMNDTFTQPLPEDIKMKVRDKVKHHIMRHQRLHHNINRKTEKYRRTISNMKKRKDIYILKADKGNSTVIMNKSEYEAKMEEHLNCGPYKRLDKNPTELYRKKVFKFCEALHKENKFDKQTFKSLISNNARTPILYGAPKIHKQDVPLRPIVSSYNSPTQKLSKLLHGILKPIVGNNFSIRNSAEFVEKLREKNIKPGEILISYDAKNLFTSIPINKLLQYTRDVLEKDRTLKARTKLSINDIITGMEICLRSTYFQFRNNFFEQEDGMAMGCPLSTIGADIFMERLEDDLIRGNHTVKFYSRYVDDIFMIIRGRQTEKVLQLLNSFDPNVQFTYEKENEQKLPFLDVLIRRQEDGKFKFSIYRKTTHTDKYLDWHSVHPKAHKITVVNTLVQRALKICDIEYLEDELEHITNTLVLLNNYPRPWVENQIKRIKYKFYNNCPTLPETMPRVILPYVPTLTESVGRIITRTLGNPLGYIPFNRMSDIVSTHKDKDICPNCGVYKISCACGALYIGETGRDLSVRMKEHQDHSRLGHIDKSAIANHTWENINDNGHHIDWDSAQIIVSEARHTQRKLMEAIIIKKAINDDIPIMNRKEEEGSCWIPNYWDSVFFKMFEDKI